MAETVKVGVIGTGAISGAYLGMAKNFPIVEIAACADLDMEKAKAQGEKFAVPKVCSVNQLLNDDSIEIVLNLTVPKAHVPIAIKVSTGESAGHFRRRKPRSGLACHIAEFRAAALVQKQLRRLRVHRAWPQVPCRGVDHMDFAADGTYLIASCEYSGELLKEIVIVI